MKKQCPECGQEIYGRSLRQEVQARRNRIERMTATNDGMRARLARMQACYARAAVALAEAEATWSEQLKAWGSGRRAVEEKER